jgi:hypothetical protein
MSVDDVASQESVLPVRPDVLLYAALAALAIVAFSLNASLTSVVIGSISALIVAIIAFFGYRATLERAIRLALFPDGMKYVDKRGRETWVPWASIVEIRPASRQPNSHYVCIYREGERSAAIPLGYDVGNNVKEFLQNQSH